MKEKLFFTERLMSDGLPKKPSRQFNYKGLFLGILIVLSLQKSVGQSNYKLPFPNGTSYVCSQGNNGSASHTGIPQYAFDFAMPVNSNVCASRGGVVSHVIENFTDYNNPSSCNDVNRVVVSHGDGTSALYLHITHNGALVSEGETVVQGQVIAKSGSTGCSTGAHLHFMVMNTAGNPWYNQSLPMSFCDYANNSGVPTSGAMCNSSTCEGLGMPDLIKISDSMSVNGNSVTFSVTIKNNGSGIAGLSSLGFFASVNSDLSFPWTIGASTVQSLPPNSTFTITRIINLCDAAYPLNSGIYYLGYKIDRLDEVLESNEGNNTFYWQNNPVTINCSQTGSGGNTSVQVYLVCNDVISAGGQWRVDGGNWFNSNETALNLAQGNHIVSFKDIPGWITPTSYSFSLSNAEHKIISFPQSQYSKNYNLNLYSYPSNGGTTAGSGLVNVGCTSGINVNISASPANGWQFDNWTENGIIVSSSPNIPITISQNRTLVANFSLITFYTISTIPNPSNGGFATNGGSLPSGSGLIIEAFPQSGWQFNNWTENGIVVSTNPQMTVIANQNRTFFANFNQILTLDENTINPILKLYPNPVYDIANVRNSFTINIQKIEVYDLTQRLIFEPDFETSDNNTKFDLSSLLSGVYLINVVYDENKNYQIKIIKN